MVKFINKSAFCLSMSKYSTLIGAALAGLFLTLNEPQVVAKPVNPKITSTYVTSTYQNRTSDSPKYAIEGEAVTLHAIVEAEINGTKKLYGSPSTLEREISLNGKKRKVERWPFTKPIRIEWYKIEPIKRWYDHTYGKWKSDPVQYAENSFALGWETVADVHPLETEDQFKIVSTGLGIMRYKVKAVYNGTKASSTGSECVEAGGICKKVHRISYRPDEKKMGWAAYVFELFNTPYIWGSTSRQIDGQIGSDCADFVTYGWRRAGHKQTYTWSVGLKDYSSKINFVSSIDTQGYLLNEKGERIIIGENGMQVGDLLIYSRHAAVFISDKGRKGYLDANDLGAHTLFKEPKVEKVPSIFGLNFEIRRWK